MHQSEPKHGSQSFDRGGRKFGLSLTKPVEKLNIDADLAGQLGIRDSCQGDRDAVLCDVFDAFGCSKKEIEGHG